MKKEYKYNCSTFDVLEWESELKPKPEEHLITFPAEEGDLALAGNEEYEFKEGEWAFGYWTSNNQPLVIPNSVTSIGDGAFRNWELVPYVEIKAVIPPTITSTSFSQTNDAPIYVPDESLDDYKTATNWVNLADRIKPLSELQR